MGELTIPNLDDVTLDILRQRARREGKSVEQEAAELIRLALKPYSDAETLIARARAISAMTPQGIEQTDSTLMIRQDRDR